MNIDEHCGLQNYIFLYMAAIILILSFAMIYEAYSIDRISNYVNHYCLNESVVVDRYFKNLNNQKQAFAWESVLNVS